MSDPSTNAPNSEDLPNRAAEDPVILQSKPPSHTAAFSPRGGLPPAPPSVKIIHEAPKRQSKPSKLRLFIGLILVTAGVLAASNDIKTWRGWITDGSIAIGWTERGNPTGVDSAPVEEASWQTPALQVGGGVLLMLGGLCLGSGLITFLVTGALMTATVLLANALLVSGIHWQPLVLVSMALTYGVQSVGREIKLSPAAIIGWALIGLSCLGSVRGWFDGTHYNWSFLGASWAEQAGDFFSNWASECAWGVVLLLTAIGVSLSRTKPIHFLNAVLLAALAYYCLQDGKLEMVAFPELAKGDVIPTIAHESLHNVQPWQWVLVGDLVLLSAIMLHLALGVGALTLAFAASWLLFGLQVDKTAGRMVMTRAAAGFAAQSIDRTTQQTPAGRSTGARTGNGGMGLPIDGSKARPAAANTASAKLAAQNQVSNAQIIGAVLPLVWVYLTAILAGIIGVCGLRMWVERADVRMWLMCALWLSFGLGAMWLYQHWPRYPDKPWNELQWLTAWGLSRYHIQAICLAALGPMAILGGWALRWNSSYRTWLGVAMVSIMTGTALSLLSIAVLIRYGGFASLPSWVYVAIAAGQSSIMWVLLMHRSLSVRRAPATA